MKVKNLKKLLTLSLAAIMTVSALGGCGNENDSAGNSNESAAQSSTLVSEESTLSSETVEDEPKEPVTLEWYYPGNGMQQDTQKVEDKLNELLEEYEGLEHVTVHMNCFTSADYAQQVLLAQTAGKQMDIVQTFNLSYYDEVVNGTFLALDEYIDSEEFSELKNELPEWLWDTLKVDGTTYVVPNYQMGATDRYLLIPEAYMQYVDLDKIDNLVMTDDPAVIAELCAEIEKVALAISDAEGITKYVGPLAAEVGSGNRYNFICRDYLVGTSGFALNYGETAVINSYMQESYKEACRLAAESVEKGLYPEDAAVTDTQIWQKQNMLNDKAYAMCIVQTYGDEELVSKNYSEQFGFDVRAFRLHDDIFVPMGWAAGGNGVTASCEHPEDALKFIEALNTEKGKEIYNLIVYGLEGVHYEKIDDEHIKTLEYDGTQGGTSTTYAAWKWVIGNTKYVYLNQGCKENENEIVDAINNAENATPSELMGFWVNKEPVATEIAQCEAVVKEYANTLNHGSMGADWEEYYNEFIEKLETAGAQKVIDELQAQVDAFLSTK